jgi:hypothetical protein
VITDDEVMRVFERADPARVDDAASIPDATGYLDALRTRSINVQLIETDESPAQPSAPSRRRWPIITAAAAAIVAIVVGGLVLAVGDEETDQTTVAAEAATDAEVVARGFLDALFAYDADRAMTYLADDALADGQIADEGRALTTPEEFRLASAWAEAVAFKQTISDCEQRGETASGVRVRCAFDYQWFRSDELGLGPYGGSYWDLTVRDGEVVAAASHLAYVDNGASKQTWEPFRTWVSTTFPDDATVMYTDDDRDYGRITEESIRLWEQRIREYVTSRVAWVTRTHAICSAAHARLNDELEAAGLATRDDPGREYERVAAPVLDETLVELRSVPPPEAIRAEFDHGYLLVQQLAQGLRETGTDTANTIDQILGLGVGLTSCTFSLPR